MAPTLADGDYVFIHTDSADADIGDIVVALVPDGAGGETTVIKRILSRGDTRFYLGSDSPTEGRDSRHFGSVEPSAFIGIVRGRLPVGRFLATRGRR